MNWSRIALLVIGVLSFFGLVTSCTNIDAGRVGVVKHLGAVQPGVISPGQHFVRPFFFASVVEVDTKAATLTTVTHASSKDLQRVASSVAVVYSYSAATAGCIVNRFGDPGSTITVPLDGKGHKPEEDVPTIDVSMIAVQTLGPAIQESVKAATAGYTAEQLIHERPAVKVSIDERIRAFVDMTLNSKGCRGAIQIANIAVQDFAFSAEFDHAIEQKVKAEQEALKAENEKRKRITDAEAEAKSLTLQADSFAYKTEVESKARADAIARESRALESNPSLVQLRIAERWNGVLPQYTGGGVPLLQIGAKQ